MAGHRGKRRHRKARVAAAGRIRFLVTPPQQQLAFPTALQSMGESEFCKQTPTTGREVLVAV